jgi:hypothetical protein
VGLCPHNIYIQWFAGTGMTGLLGCDFSWHMAEAVLEGRKEARCGMGRGLTMTRAQVSVTRPSELPPRANHCFPSIGTRVP